MPLAQPLWPWGAQAFSAGSRKAQWDCSAKHQLRGTPNRLSGVLPISSLARNPPASAGATWQRQVAAVLAPRSLPSGLQPYILGKLRVLPLSWHPPPPGHTSPLAAAPGSVGPDPGPERIRGTLPGQSPPSGAQASGSPHCPWGAPGAPRPLELSIPAGGQKMHPPPSLCQGATGPRAPPGAGPPRDPGDPLPANSTKQLRKEWPLCLPRGLSWSPHKELANFHIAWFPKYHHNYHPTPQTPPQNGMEVSL